MPMPNSVRKLQGFFSCNHFLINLEIQLEHLAPNPLLRSYIAPPWLLQLGSEAPGGSHIFLKVLSDRFLI